jgi:hypothetical protein
MIQELRKTGLNSTTLYLSSFISVLLSIGIWFMRRSDDRANAERFGIFIGLWAPTLMQLANAFQTAEQADENKAVQ